MDKLKPASITSIDEFFKAIVGRYVIVRCSATKDNNAFLTTGGTVVELNRSAGVMLLAYSSIVELVYLNSIVSILPSGDGWDWSK